MRLPLALLGLPALMRALTLITGNGLITLIVRLVANLVAGLALTLAAFFPNPLNALIVGAITLFITNSILAFDLFKWSIGVALALLQGLTFFNVDLALLLGSVVLGTIGRIFRWLVLPLAWVATVVGILLGSAALMLARILMPILMPVIGAVAGMLGLVFGLLFAIPASLLLPLPLNIMALIGAVLATVFGIVGLIPLALLGVFAGLATALLGLPGTFFIGIVAFNLLWDALFIGVAINVASLLHEVNVLVLKVFGWTELLSLELGEGLKNALVLLS